MNESLCVMSMHAYVHVCMCFFFFCVRSCDIKCIREKERKQRKLICSWQLLACGDWPVACDWEVVRWKTAV